MILPPFLIPKELYSDPAGASVEHRECSTRITMLSRRNIPGSLISIFILILVLSYSLQLLSGENNLDEKLKVTGFFLLVFFVVVIYNLSLVSGKRVVKLIPHYIVITDHCGPLVSESTYSGSEISELRIEKFYNFYLENSSVEDYGIFFNCEGGSRICVAFSDDERKLKRIFKLLETSTAFNCVSSYNKNTPEDVSGATGVNDDDNNDDIYRVDINKM
ncbi:MAG: hypothetical protein LWY06_01695 [Firmicutes bacterium]|nr:hypothetical protein [Bacillota bacterium]